MIKKIVLIIVLAIFSFSACKTEKKAEPQSAPKSATSKSATPSKEKEAGLELYKETNLVATIPAHPNRTYNIRSCNASRRAPAEQALLSDLLKRFKLAGKNVVLSGHYQSQFLTMEQALQSQIYICLAWEGFFRAYDQQDGFKIGDLTKIQVTDRGDSELRVGDTVPDLSLISLDGKSQRKLTSFIGTKPLVLIFGSFT